MEQVNSNDVIISTEGSENIIDLTGDEDEEEYYVLEDTTTEYIDCPVDDEFLDQYITKVVMVRHSWSTSARYFMENSSPISDEDTENSSPISDEDTENSSLITRGMANISYVFHPNMESDEAEAEEMDEAEEMHEMDEAGEMLEMDSSITSHLRMNNGSSHSSFDEIDEDDTLHSMVDNEYDLEFEGQLNDVQHVEHSDQHVEHNDQQVQHDNTTDVSETQAIILSSDDESEIPQKLKKVVVSFDNIHFITTTSEQQMFPCYSQLIFEKIIEDIKKRLDEQNRIGLGKLKFGVLDLMRVLKPNAWLNDLVIDAYFKLIVRDLENVHYLDSYFISKIGSPGFTINPNFNDYIDLYLYDRVLIPIHVNGNHWALLMIVHQTSEIFYYNSQEPRPDDELEKLSQFLSKFDTFSYPMMQPRQWHIRDGGSPIQYNNNDCGIFTCTNARHLAFKKPLKYTHFDIPLARHRITYELLNNVLIPFADR